jgi:linearmycin/streptolysin S transport system permease protein
MIAAVIRLGWTNLKRDRVALFLTFLLPLVFFSIFASIFGNLRGGSSGESKPLTVLAVDQDGTAISSALIAALAGQDGLDVLRTPVASENLPAPRPWSREGAVAEVRGGRAAAAVVIPAGFGSQYGNFGQSREPVEVVYDASNPLAKPAVAGMLQAAAFQAAPAALIEGGFVALEEAGGGGMTEAQRAALGQIQAAIDSPVSGRDQTTGRNGGGGLIQVRATAARDDSEDDQEFSMVAYYAAGIGVMFLLFSMSAAAGTLLDDQESGTLERLLTSNLTMAQLLVGKWLFYLMVGTVQVILMFCWGSAAFGLELFTLKTLAGFSMMAVTTAAAAAAFGILLATLCKSRAQLGGTSTIVILIMSALGGSMVPKFAMPAFMDVLSKFTFNGWALDGFLKVFWYDDPDLGVGGSLVALAPQVAVLGGACVVFLLIARRLARRWEGV